MVRPSVFFTTILRKRSSHILNIQGGQRQGGHGGPGGKGGQGQSGQGGQGRQGGQVHVTGLSHTFSF